jgi:hypothetical protein
VFVFVVIKAKVSDLHAHADILSDFLPQQTITKTGTGSVAPPRATGAARRSAYLTRHDTTRHSQRVAIA